MRNPCTNRSSNSDIAVTAAYDRGSTLDTQLGEEYYKGQKQKEEDLTDQINRLIERYVDKRWKQGRRPALRDAHAKDTGIVKAKFHVDTYLDPKFQRGVFVPGRTYDAWIRFSNGNSECRPDWLPDARGMAIKLMAVDDTKERLLSKPEIDYDHCSQDFILINSPVFFVDDLEDYRDTLESFLKRELIAQWLSVFNLKGRDIWLALKANLTLVANPLFCRYWSTTPYRLGAESDPDRIAIKFMVRPWSAPYLIDRWCSFFMSGFSLRKALFCALSNERAFDFYIQPYIDSEHTPIENTRTEWLETISPPIHVAKIVIPSIRSVVDARNIARGAGNLSEARNIADDLAAMGIRLRDVKDPTTTNKTITIWKPDGKRDPFFESLSFNPWHGLVEHKPLGAVNRVRKIAYLKNCKHRHKLNRVHRNCQGRTGDSRF